MLPLIAIATSIIPDLIKLIAGDKAGTVATDVSNAVKQVTGTSDPAAAKQKISADPTVAANLQIQLAQIALAASKAQYDAQDQQRQAELTDVKQRLADIQSARTNLLDLAKTQSPIAWVAPAVSAVVMIGFFALLAILIVFYGKDDDVSKNQLINISIGALVAAFSTVVNFWLGSSKGSQDKDKTQAEQTAEVLRAQTQQTNTALSTANAATEKAAATATAAATSAGSQGAGGSGALKTDKSTNFDKCLAVVFAEEGGYTNDPQDSGGPTNFGITLADLREWRGHDVTAEDVRTMNRTEAQEIYRSKYWNPMQCDDLPNGIDLEVFDFGVNAGNRTSIKILQSVLGVTTDGSVGPITLSAAKAADARTVIQNFSEQRLNYYRALAGWAHFGAGWTNRTNSVERTALTMAGPVIA
jgi:hypothetical protein